MICFWFPWTRPHILVIKSQFVVNHYCDYWVLRIIYPQFYNLFSHLFKKLLLFFSSPNKKHKNKNKNCWDKYESNKDSTYDKSCFGQIVDDSCLLTLEFKNKFSVLQNCNFHFFLIHKNTKSNWHAYMYLAYGFIRYLN